MNRLTDAADQYLKSCTWRDLALLKICVCALGVLIGLALPGRKKRRAAWAASLVFAAAYIPLMGKFLPFLLGQHQIERHGRMHRRPAFDGTDSTHSFPTSKKRYSRGPVRNTRPAVTLA